MKLFLLECIFIPLLLIVMVPLWLLEILCWGLREITKVLETSVAFLDTKALKVYRPIFNKIEKLKRDNDVKTNSNQK